MDKSFFFFSFVYFVRCSINMYVRVLMFTKNKRLRKGIFVEETNHKRKKNIIVASDCKTILLIH